MCTICNIEKHTNNFYKKYYYRNKTTEVYNLET